MRRAVGTQTRLPTNRRTGFVRVRHFVEPNLGFAGQHALGRIDACPLVELPPDRRRIEEHVGAEQRGRACRLGKPLIPADEDAEATRGGYWKIANK